MLSPRAAVTAVLVSLTIVYGGLRWRGDQPMTPEQADLAARAGRQLRGADVGPPTVAFVPRPATSARKGWLSAPLAMLQGASAGIWPGHLNQGEVASTWVTDKRNRQLEAAAVAPGIEAVFLGTEGEALTCGMEVAIKFDCIEDIVNGTKVYDTGCSSQVQGFVNYIMFHECTMKDLQWLSFIALVAWLLFLLYMLGDTADVYFCPTLDVIVLVLNLSPNIAGVTFLSFGNGAPDVFASIAATLSGNPNVGVSAILGAGVFTTTIIVGVVSFVSEVELDRRPFLRDIGFFIASTGYLLYCFSDSKVSLGEAVGFLAFYVVFAVVVIVGRSVYQRWKKQSKAAQGGEALLDTDGHVMVEAGGGMDSSTGLLAGTKDPHHRDQGEDLAAPDALVSALGGGGRRPSGISMQRMGTGPAGSAAGRTASGRAAAGQRALSIDWFLAESQKAQMAVIAEAGAGTAPSDAEGDSKDAPAAAAAAASGAPAASPGLIASRPSRRDLAIASARHHVAGKQGRSVAGTGSATAAGQGELALAASASRRLSDGDVRHRARADTAGSFSWLEPLHMPTGGLFTSHKRRTLRFLRAVGYGADDEHAGEEGPASVAASLNRGPDGTKGRRHHHHHAGGHHHNHIHHRPEGADDDEGGAIECADSEGSCEEPPGMCDAYLGPETTMGRILSWVLLPSALIRRISSPLVGEEEYVWYWVTLTPLFGVPLIFVTAFASIGNPAGVLDTLGGEEGSTGGFCYLVLAFLLGLVGSAASFFLLPRDKPPEGILLTVFVLFGFLSSVSWIINIANEIVTLLVALGFAMDVSAEILGLTVLAWGNSLGDFVADVSVARAGAPKMALGACFAGPMFNLLLGLGMSLTIQALKMPDGVVDLTNPSGNQPLGCHQMNIVWACFGFLLLSLVASIIIIPLDGFRVRRLWGSILIGLYVVYIATCMVLQFTDLGCSAGSS